jgi:hypothetical protein
MSANAGYEIRVLLAGNCPDDETCFMVGEVSARPGKVQLVAKEITDQRLTLLISTRSDQVRCWSRSTSPTSWE